MIAETLALALVLAGPAARPAPAREASVDDATRARRGLLPRKATRPRPAARGRRVVLLPAAPTWLGEPTGVPDRDAAPALEPAATALAPEEPGTWAAVRATVEGVDVGLLLVRRAPQARVQPPIRAALSGAVVASAVLIRRAPR